MPKISIIIPVYNVEKYLKQCIESVLNQSFKEIEILLVNDGSTDKSGDICDEYARKDNRIKVIHKINGGLSDARNVGTLAATGEYLMYLDSDDFWIEGCLEDIQDILLRNPQVEVVLCKFAKYYKKDRIIIKPALYDETRILGRSKEEVLNYLFETEQYEPSASLKVLNREFIIKNNLLFQVGLLSEDIEWNLRMMLAAHSFASYNKAFYMYRQNRVGSISNTGSIKHIANLVAICSLYKKAAEGVGDEQLKINLLDYSAFQMSIALLKFSTLNKEQRAKIEKDINQAKHYLSYAIRGKQKKIHLIYKIIGRKIVLLFKGYYIVNKYLYDIGIS
ncbi:glycosyl transferase [Sporanaerobium hydrogeniformans]|uniref:Glycosyl transferase n=1 Tax=Sporanaerobium hydrogeniformans TaxID=3072179 RepID=A0AC61DBP1_9FIRM|nr:glycosyltransferase [Sporanaerobium hydrogeniformans]PHV70151.1 glycosyl transferase [Sporanaerobium hydrogeniformans]